MERRLRRCNVVWLILCVAASLACFSACGGEGTGGKDGGSGSQESGQRLDGVLTEKTQSAETTPEPVTETTTDASQEEIVTLPETNPEPEAVPEPEPEPSKATTIETKLAKVAAAAGESVDVLCEVKDQRGDVMTQAKTTLEVTPTAIGQIGDDKVAFEKVGVYQIACKLKDDSLKDSSPETLKVIAALPAAIETTLTPSTIKAGESAQASCAVSDSYGNPVIGVATTLQVKPTDKITITGDKISGTKAGEYTVACAVKSDPTTFDGTPEILRITPGLPAKIEVKANPQETYYDPGDTILLDRKVTDKYGNEIKNSKVKVSASPSQGFNGSGAPNDISFDKDGNYKVTITVDGPTASGKTLSVTLSFRVDGGGPQLTVTSPVRAAMVTGSSRSIAVTGTLKDSVSGVAGLKINGQTVAVAANGSFRGTVSANWGLNLLRFEAKDKKGNVTIRAQSFLWSPRYQAMGSSRISKSLVARLNQKAIDDGDRRTLNDMASILEKVINSLDIDKLVPLVLVSGNYKIPPFGPRVGYSVKKNGRVTMGRREVKLTARTGGLNFWARVRDVRVPLRGSAARFLNKSVTILGSYVDITGSIDVSLRNGQVTVGVRSIYADVSRVQVRAFSGLFSFLNGAVTRTLRGRIKSALENAIRGALPGPIKNFLSGFKLNTGITLPDLLGKKRLNLGTQLDGLVFDSRGGTLSMAVGVSSTRGIASGKRGTPLRGQFTPRWSTGYAFGAALTYNILNHALATAWYSGALKRDLTKLIPTSAASKLPFQPKNLKVLIDAQLPLVLHKTTSTSSLDVGLGDLKLTLSFDAANIGRVTAEVYMTAMFTGSVTLSSKNELGLSLAPKAKLFAVDVVKVTGLGPGNAAGFGKLIEQLSPQLVQFLSASVVQKFPIPSIDLSALGGKYGIPKGSKLTITRGRLGLQTDYLTVTGDLKSTP